MERVLADIEYKYKTIEERIAEEEAKKMELERGYVFKEDAGRGYRNHIQ